MTGRALLSGSVNVALMSPSTVAFIIKSLIKIGGGDEMCGIRMEFGMKRGGCEGRKVGFK